MQPRIGKISYRLRYRSTREMDLIFRQFWKNFKDNCSDGELANFEKLVEEDDHDLYCWVSGVKDVPADYQSLVHQIAKQIRQVDSNK